MTWIIKEQLESPRSRAKSFRTGVRSGSCSDNTNYQSGLIIARDYKKGRTKDSKLRKTIARIGTMGPLLLPPVPIISWTSKSCAPFLRSIRRRFCAGTDLYLEIFEWGASVRIGGFEFLKLISGKLKLYTSG